MIQEWEFTLALPTVILPGPPFCLCLVFLSLARPEVLSLIQRLPSCPKTAFFVVVQGCWYCDRAGSPVDVLLLLLASNLVYFCFGPSGACVYHGLLFEVGEPAVLGKGLRGCW